MSQRFNSLDVALTAAAKRVHSANAPHALADLIQPQVSARDRKLDAWCSVASTSGEFNSLARTALAREMYRQDARLSDRAVAVLKIEEILAKESSTKAHQRYSRELFKLNLSIWSNWFKGFIKSPLTVSPPPCLEALYTEGLSREIGIDSRFTAMFRHQLQSAQADKQPARNTPRKEIKYSGKIEPFFDQRTGFVGAQISYPWELTREVCRANTVFRVAMGVSHTRETLSRDIIVPAPKSPLIYVEILFANPPFPARTLKIDPAIHEPVRLKKVHNGPGELATLLLGYQACMRQASYRYVDTCNLHGAILGKIRFVSKSILTGRFEKERDSQRVRRALGTEEICIPLATMTKYADQQGEHVAIIPLSRSFAQVLLKEGVGFSFKFKVLHQFYPASESLKYAGESWRQGGMPTTLPNLTHASNAWVRPVNGAPGAHVLEAFEEGQLDASTRVRNAYNVRLTQWLYGLDDEALEVRSQCSVHNVKRNLAKRGVVTHSCGFTFASRFLRSNTVFPKGEYFIMPLPWKDATTQKVHPGKGALLAIPRGISGRRTTEEDCFVILRKKNSNPRELKGVTYPRDLMMAPFKDFRPLLQTDRISL